MRTTTVGTHRVRRGAAVLLLAMVLPAGLSACGTITERAQTGSGAVATSSSTQEQSGDESGAEEQGGGNAPSGGASAGAVGELEAVVASAEGELPQDLGAEGLARLRFDVLALERIEGDAVELRFTLTNLSDLPWERWSSMQETGTGVSGDNSVGGISLLDLPGDRRYLVLRDSEETCLCSNADSSLPLEPGASREYHASYPAPPESTTTVDLQVPGFAPLRGVEITS